jgi:hypothetical protein
MEGSGATFIGGSNGHLHRGAEDISKILTHDNGIQAEM